MSPAIPTARAVDHFAITVPDLDLAVRYFSTMFGAAECYRESPVHDPDGDRMATRLGVHPQAVAHVAMLRLGNSNLELFEYHSPDPSPPFPQIQQTGAYYLGLAVDGQAEESWVRAPWGLSLKLGPQRLGGFALGTRSPGRVSGIDHLGFTVDDAEIARAFFVDVLGARVLEAHRPVRHGPWQGMSMTLRLGPTLGVELLTFPDGGTARPRNSDVGGHHLAFYVDDVDRAAEYLAAQRGVVLMGPPETITEGPLAGDRWVYFQTSIGIQMEIINMPDGHLPYEKEATALRARVDGLVWPDLP